ncbi:MAG: 3-phosphoshikimate 1-carboxyvinyltransferase [Acidobacteria bacterium]|nr:3-phosphoshikimate 1-carboxyvinyltransferase [Acidobacteriota bacterium]
MRATIGLPPSKSVTNRALIAAAAAGGGEIVSPLACDDTVLLASALARCGWDVRWPGVLEAGGQRIGETPHDPRHGSSAAARPVTIGARTAPRRQVALDLGNSGTGSRFLLALLSAMPGRCIVDGSSRLRERPMGPLLGALRTLGARIETADAETLPVAFAGRQLEGGRVKIAPGASSQFVSALMMMAPLTRRGLDIVIEGALPSRPYLDLTAEVLRAFGVEVACGDGGARWHVSPDRLLPARYRVEGDWSAAAFFLAAAAVTGGTVTVGPLASSSAQGDRVMAAILERAGARVAWNANEATLSGPLHRPVDADLSATPDLFPALAVAAAAAPPGSRLTGLENLRYKESDRLGVMADDLQRLGAAIEVSDGTFEVRRGIAPGRSGTRVTAAGDHRIAMAMAVAALRAGELMLDDGACVAKSFPGFWEQWLKVTG